MNTKLTPEEHWQLGVYRDALQEIFDYGRWVEIDGRDYWAIPEETSQHIDRLLEDIDNG